MRSPICRWPTVRSMFETHRKWRLRQHQTTSPRAADSLFFLLLVANNIAQDASKHVRYRRRTCVMKSLEMAKMHLNVGSILRHKHSQTIITFTEHTIHDTRTVDDRMTNHLWKFRSRSQRFHFDHQENDSDELMKCDHSCSGARKQYFVWMATREIRNSRRTSEWAAEQIASDREDKVQAHANNTGLSQKSFSACRWKTRSPRDNATNERFQHTPQFWFRCAIRANGPHAVMQPQKQNDRTIAVKKERKKIAANQPDIIVH